MRRFFVQFCGCLLTLSAVVLFIAPASADYTTTVNPNTNWGIWKGWGCSLAWWANEYGANTNMADAIFTLKNPIELASSVGTYPVPGLGFNVARYNVGGTSTDPITIAGATYYPSNPSTYSSYRMIQNYWLDWGSADPTSSSWDWTRDANQRNMMELAKERGVDIFQMFSNSPPWWMCYNSSTAGSNGGGDNLQSWNYDQFALYLATVARYAADNWGIHFESVEPFNEPSASWWTYPCTQEGCHFDVSTQNSVILYLRQELDKQGLRGMKIATSDENTCDEELAAWNSLTSSAQSDCAQIDTHGYMYAGGRRDLLYDAARAADKILWDSEYGENDPSGLSMASNINLDLRWLHPTVWCYWQPFDGSDWGMINDDDPNSDWVGMANPKWFVMAQYSRHIRPGMIMIDGGEGNTIAAYAPREKKLVLVTTNYGAAQNITYDLSMFTNVAGPIVRWDTNTAGGDMHKRHTDILLAGKSFTSAFPADTVQTFEIDNVSR